MGIILTSTGLPLLTSEKVIASSPARVPIPVPKPTPEPGGFALGEPVSELTYRGVTVKLSTPLPYFWSANGDPVFITTQASSVTSFSVPSVTDANGLRHSGAMKNPEEYRDGNRQGFDAAIGTRPSGRYEHIIYNEALNVDPAVAGPLSISQGSSFSLVKCVRDPNWSYPNGWKSVQKYVVFTFMAAPPLSAGAWFRPAVSTTAKSYPGRVEDMTLAGSTSPLRHLPKPSGLKNPSHWVADISSQDLHTLPIWYGTTHGRRVQPSREADSDSGYARDHGKMRGQIACSLFIDQPYIAEQLSREKLATIITQWGIDCDGANQSGNKHSAGAGQWHGYIEFYYIAAFLLGDAAMLARAKTHRSNALNQQFWVTEAILGYPVDWDTGSDGSGARRSSETYFPHSRGKPEWTQQGTKKAPLGIALTDIIEVPHEDNGNLNESVAGNYRDIYYTNAVVETLPIALLRNGPSGETGIEAINSIGSGQVTTAVLPWVDRCMTLYPVHDGGSLAWHRPEATSTYDAWRDEVRYSNGAVVPRWKGRPDIWASHNTPNFRTGSTAGTIDWNLTDYATGRTFNFATETITDRELEVSQDNVQFVKRTSIGTATSRTLTGLRPGTPHWCRWRQTSASGSGPWSPTWFQRHSNQTSTSNNYLEADRHKMNSGGSAPSAGTIVNEVLPALYYMQCPEHPTPRFEPAPANFADAKVYGPNASKVQQLIAGIGYWSGGSGTPSIRYNSNYDVVTISGWTVAYQWQRNGVNISGATGQRYTLQGADRGQSIRCRVIVNGVSVNSNAVSVP